MGIFLPYQVDVPMERIPWANWVLIAITTVCSLAGMGSAMEFGEVGWIWSWCLDRGEGFHVYQLVTHLFVHDGFLHLAVNMLFLFVFGNAINAKLGHAYYLAAYLLMGAISGWAWMVFPPRPDRELLLGASGAICGVTGMFFVLYPFNEVAIFYAWFFFRAGDMGITYWSSIWLIGLYILLDLVGVFLWYFTPVAYIAHLAGYAIGFVAALALLASGVIRPAEGEMTLLPYFGIGELLKKPKRKKKKKRSLITREPPPEAPPPPSTQPPGSRWADWGD
ncbi:hypothetical protein HRbin36_01155 [bacterium HR36]|uniref:Rhomboid family protein n=1 Tax=uncultured Planctomycetota bacterium TaxID=120965 RepID=H5SJR7_9BACT|nr:rhomboid family protein [uncultured Planctomycetota bacterium]GBD36038.1 hypothetical protein HRbin36_01155 [bacterium HR36]